MSETNTQLAILQAASLVPATLDDAIRIEAKVASSIALIDDLNELQELRRQYEALERYWRDKKMRGPMLGIQRRIEARIGQLLGEPNPGQRTDLEPPSHEMEVKRKRGNADAHDFRVLSRAVGKIPEQDWRQSRRALVAEVRKLFPQESRTSLRTEHIRAMAAENKTGPDIAAELNVSRGYVNDLAKAAGIKLRDARVKVSNLLEEIRTRAAAGQSPADAAHGLGVTEGHVREIAKGAGITWATRPKQAALGRAQRVRAIREHSAAGYRATQIAQMIGKSVEYVRQVARDESIVLPDAALGRVHNKLSWRRIIEKTVEVVSTHTQDFDIYGVMDLSDIEAAEAHEWCARLDETIKALKSLSKQLREHIHGCETKQKSAVEIESRGNPARQAASLSSGAEEVR